MSKSYCSFLKACKFDCLLDSVQILYHGIKTPHGLAVAQLSELRLLQTHQTLHKFRTFQILSCVLYHFVLLLLIWFAYLSYTTQRRMLLFCLFFFLHSTSNLTYCLRKRTLGVRASWLGSHEHSVAHEMWVVGSLRPQLIIYIPIHPFSRQGLTNYFLRVCLFLFV